MAVNEKTGKRVASIAARILRHFEKKAYRANETVAVGMDRVCSVSELKALAASALTQVGDRKKVGRG